MTKHLIFIVVLLINNVISFNRLEDGNLSCLQTFCCEISYFPGIYPVNDINGCYCVGDYEAGKLEKYSYIPTAVCTIASWNGTNTKQCHCNFQIIGGPRISTSATPNDTCIMAPPRYIAKNPLCENYDIAAWNAISKESTTIPNNDNSWMISTIVLSTIIGCSIIVVLIYIYRKRNHNDSSKKNIVQSISQINNEEQDPNVQEETPYFIMSNENRKDSYENQAAILTANI
jgi:hypothetical protein